MDKVVIRHTGECQVDWNKEPVFEFATEVDALETLMLLGDALEMDREQVRQTMRYLTAAVRAARQGSADGDKATPQAIINHSGLARQTVYNMLDERSD